MSAAKRITQKELRQPDEFVTATGRVVEWAKENQRTVAAGAIGLVGVLVVIALVSWWISSRNASANQQFYSAIELYKAEQWQEAYEGFKGLVDDLGGTDYGRLGTLYAGRTALKLEKPAEAVPYYREYLSGSTTVALEQLARLNLGRALAQTGDSAGARNELDQALALAGPARPEATLELARLEERDGATERALELYGRYLEDNPQGPAKDLVRARIVALGGTPPAVETPGFPGGRSPLQLRME